MKDILADIKLRASALNKTIVLPEGEDSRVVEAAAKTVNEKVAKIILLGDESEIVKNNPNVCLDGVTIVNPVEYKDTDKYAQMLFDIRKGKINKKTGEPEYATVEDAKNYILKDYTMYGALMLKADDVDGMVSGACHSTANTLRPGLQVIKTGAGEKMVSAYFLMIAPPCGNKYCEDGCYIYADSGLVQNPTSEELAYIALSSAKSAEQVANLTPRIAFISHSSKGSAKHADVTKVTEAVSIFKEIAPNYNADGELQFDAAIVPEVAKSKAPNSTVAGHANVLVFPDLDAGNSNYKNTERLGGFMAIGPICQGLAKPINDLSRGCATDDIVAAVAITVLQTQN